MIPFGGDSVRIFFSCRPQYAILGTGILDQVASFERRLRGAAHTLLALPYPSRTWPGSGTWAEQDKREVRKFLYFGRYTPELFLDTAYVELSMEIKKHMRKHFKLASFPNWLLISSPPHIFSRSHLEAFGLLSYDCCVVAFRYRISRYNTFV